MIVILILLYKSYEGRTLLPMPSGINNDEEIVNTSDILYKIEGIVIKEWFIVSKTNYSKINFNQKSSASLPLMI